MNAASAVAIDDRLAGHGGRLCVARALHPQAPQPWIDLSTGINPKPYPAPRANSSARARLPEPQELRALEQVAARAFGVAEQDCVVAVGGSEAALRLMPYVLQVDRAAIVGPTYSSHEDAWRKAGSCVDVVERTHGLLMPSSPHPNPPPLRRGGSPIDIPLNSQPRPFPCEAGAAPAHPCARAIRASCTSEGQDGGARVGLYRNFRPHPSPPPLRRGGNRGALVLPATRSAEHPALAQAPIQPRCCQQRKPSLPWLHLDVHPGMALDFPRDVVHRAFERERRFQ